MTPTLELLDHEARRMADAVASLLPAVTRGGYAAFVDAMAHYTRRSGERLEAAARAAEAAGAPDLRELFERLASDERDHYKLAEADLRTLGAAPSPAAPAAVRAFEAWWAGLAGGAPHLGALAVLEGVAKHVGAAAGAHLARLGLAKTEARFVLVHLEADAEHGALLAHACARHEVEHAPALLEAARAAAEHWITIHRDALTRLA